MNDKQKQICSKVNDTLCRVSWVLEGLIAVKELTHWSEDELTEKMQSKLEWMIQPVLKYVSRDIVDAMENMSHIDTEKKEVLNEARPRI